VLLSGVSRAGKGGRKRVPLSERDGPASRYPGLRNSRRLALCRAVEEMRASRAFPSAFANLRDFASGETVAAGTGRH
jgi:hypothetical protein